MLSKTRGVMHVGSPMYRMQWKLDVVWNYELLEL